MKEKDIITEDEFSLENDFDDKKKKNYRLEIVLIFVIGFLLGVMIKTEALKRVAIGYDDYKVVTGKQGYNIEKIEKELIKKQKEAQEKAREKAQKNSNESTQENK